MKRSFLPVLAASAVAAAAQWPTRAPAGDRETMAADPPVPEAIASEEAYRLAERDGVVAVFSPAGAAEPREITDIRVELLPSADRERLRSGIPAGDPRELAMLLEDLGS